VEWKSIQAVPLNPTPILLGNQLYTISDSGVLSCLEATTGKLTWRRRLGGNYSASPVFADGRLYVLNEAGETTVVEPGDKYQFLAKNPLRGTTLASISIARHALFIRTDTELFRVEQLSRNDAPETGSSDTGESVTVPPATKVIQPPASAAGIRLRGRKTPTETPQAPNP
jgi:outer membrane protein assembly factor BamB